MACIEPGGRVEEREEGNGEREREGARVEFPRSLLQSFLFPFFFFLPPPRCPQVVLSLAS